MARAAAEALEPLPASGVRIVEAATVICVRRAPAGQAAPRTLHHGDYELDADGTKQLGKFHWSFSSGLQVLMGQSEVINWVRSAPEKTSYMRYAGEWKFPGGSVDSGETLATTAVRELSEEFRVTVPANAVMEPFNVKFTRAIQGKSFTMFNFLCAADENPWLQHLDLDVVNASLSSRRQKFDALLESGDFWKLNKAERMEVSPEVHRVEWLDLSAAVEMCLTSKAVDLTPVNDWQREAYAKYRIKRRDPMYATMFALKDVEAAGSLNGLRELAQDFDVEDARRRSAARFAAGEDNAGPSGCRPKL